MVPYTYWQGFDDTLANVAGLTAYEIEEGYFVYDCAERDLIPDLYFMFDYNWYEMSARDFTISVDNQVCSISIVAN
jgi:hypothetical protein